MTLAARDRFERCRTLPAPAAGTVHLLRLFDRSNVAVLEVARAIDADVAQAGRVVRLLNAPLFGAKKEAATIQAALTFYGGKTVGDHVLALALTRDLRKADRPGFDAAAFWRHAVVTAVAATEMARGLGAAGLAEVFLAGLLRHVGILAMVQALGETYVQALATAPMGGRDLEAREKTEFGCTRGEATVWLLERWHLRSGLLSLMRAAHQVDTRTDPALDERVVRALRLSGGMAGLLVDSSSPAAVATLKAEAEEVLFLSPEAIGGLLERISAATPLIAEILDVHLPAPELAAGRAAVQSRLDGTPEAPPGLALPRRGSPAASTMSGAYTDGLMDAYVPEIFEPHLRRACAEAASGGRALSLLLCDPDGLDRINTLHGREVGDRLLGALARKVRACLRDNDLTSRHLDARVVVLLADVASEIAPRVAERLRRQIEGHKFDVGIGQPLSTPVSIGCATLDLAAASSAELLRAAESALRNAKADGRNRVSSGPAVVKGAA